MSDRWRDVSLSDVVTRVTAKNEDGGIERVLTASARHGLIAQERFFTRKVASSDTSPYYVVQPGQFVYNKSATKDAPFGTVARNNDDIPGIVSPLYFVFEAHADNALPEYLELALNSAGFFASLGGMLRKGARSHGLLNVRLKEFYGAQVTLPPLPVQERIVEVVRTIDEQLTSLDSEAAALASLYAGHKEAVFARFEATADRIPLGEVIQEVKRPVSVDLATDYLQIGVRSHGKGVFTKEPLTGESLGSKKVFWVEPGDLVVNIVFAWEGAVAVVPPEIVGYCASHRFPTYRRTDEGDVDFIRMYLSTKKGVGLLGDSSPGGAGRNRTLNRKVLLGSPLALPSLAEQNATVDELRAMESALISIGAEADRLRSVRASLLTALMNRDIEIKGAEGAFA